MKDLIKGFKNFYSNDFKRYKELFSILGKSQDPHTLFICCSDSRVVPHLLTDSMPGELFVVRNIANIVPYYRESNEYLSTTSAIEYAVNILRVSSIIICGHSNCGGCRAFYLSDEELKDIPHTRKWIKLAKPILQEIKKDSEIMNDSIKRAWFTEQLNLRVQIDHLLTYPYINNKYQNGEINIFGWYYIIETGEIYNYNIDKKTFSKIE